MVNADPRPLQSAVYEGWVRHRRSVPRAHAFRYRMYMLYLDLAELDRVFADRWLWSVGRRNLVEFRRSDYHGDPSIALDMAIRDTVEKRSGARPNGPIRMLAHLRTFGHCFNPVCFYYGYAEDGETLEWILAEISNIPWNERHAYLLPIEDAQMHGSAHAWKFRKQFHVSPFMPLAREYDWRSRHRAKICACTWMCVPASMWKWTQLWCWIDGPSMDGNSRAAFFTIP